MEMTANDSGDGSIFYHYELYPEKIKEYGNVKRIYTRQGEFALKESSLQQEEADWLIHVVRRLNRLGYRNLVPIIPTKYGEYTLSTDTHTYYLMPWIHQDENRGDMPMERVIVEQMGEIHRLTVKSQAYEREDIDQSYQSLLTRWERRKRDLEQFAEQAEGKVYISPFELTLLTHHHFLNAMIETAKTHLKTWYDQCIEKEKYRSVLCHGKLSRQHLLLYQNNQPLLFNFERATLDTPARDLALFYRYSLPYAKWDEEEILNWYGIYNQQLPLLEEERHLLASYLSFPEPILYAIDSYRQQPLNMTELAHVQRLEKRLLMQRRIHRMTNAIVAKNDGQ
ncbi:spore coat protein YsxE [Bacillus sp. FJAT-45350]|uniref:spore coat protein YsxE n=1 Tax=Bacillus sp. FJAT-45350 TaxID=2011014 RepID=UPI00211C4BAA|nr:spore coat protein YsxE [Bacillus sp. FJAT-45350]